MGKNANTEDVKTGKRIIVICDELQEFVAETVQQGIEDREPIPEYLLHLLSGLGALSATLRGQVREMKRTPSPVQMNGNRLSGRSH